MRDLDGDAPCKHPVKYSEMVDPLLAHVRGRADRVRAEAFRWLDKFLEKAPRQSLLTFAADILVSTRQYLRKFNFEMKWFF